MKIKTKIAIWSLAALLAAGFTACKDDDPFSKLTEDSLENTAWTLEKTSEYNKGTQKWEIIGVASDIRPFATTQFIERKIERVDDYVYEYAIDVAKRELIIKSNNYPIVELSSDKLVYDDNENHRFAYKRIPPLLPAKLYGKWEITALEKHDFHSGQWKTGTFEKGYWIQFNKDGSGTNSRKQNCKYSIRCNIVNIDCIYGKSFVVKLTDKELVFLHRYKNTGNYTRETFKKVK
ncbi:MAG: hypothetical protein ACOYEG_12790 [Petrimonas sp.]|jgi:hypothetical protein